MATVFQKTTLGVRELSERSGQVPLKARQLLVMIDGKRNDDELGRLMPGAGDFLKLLQQLGLVAPLGAVEDAPAIVHGPYDSLPSDTQLQRVRRTVQRSAQQFLGERWAQDLDTRFNGLQHGDALQVLVADWLNALRRSGHRGAADQGEREILALLAPH
ncbi:hypothetical protein ACTSKR_15945 [Chitinibacteraceae bacterium HSL-7]